MSEVIERIKARFAAEAVTTLADIAGAIDELGSGGRQHEVAGYIREQAHGLKGAAAVLEFEEFRDRVAALEDAAAELVTSQEWPPEAAGRLADLLSAAREASPRSGK